MSNEPRLMNTNHAPVTTRNSSLLRFKCALVITHHSSLKANPSR